MKCPCLCCSDFLSAPEDGVMMHAAGRKLHISVQLEPAPLLLQSLGFFLFFLSQSDYYLAAGQAQITWLDPFFPLALPCSGLSTSVPWLCSWSIISQWAGLLMDCFLVYFWGKAPGSAMSLSATDLWRFILVLLNLLDTSARVWCEESETAYVQVLNYFQLSLLNNISSFCILMMIVI